MCFLPLRPATIASFPSKPPVFFARLAPGLSRFAKRIHHRQRAKKLSYAPDTLPWEYSLENGQAAFRQEADTRLAQHDASDQSIAGELTMKQQPPDSLFVEKRDSIAKAIHDKYRRDQQGRKTPDDPAMAPWERLSEPLKESNRHQAGHIVEKLKRIECDIRLPASGQAEPFTFEPAEEEILAEMEHDRWVAERLREGWQMGPRDPEKKITPYLVAWDQLEEEIKEYDRDAVRGIPGTLAEVGFEIYRHPSK